jgi:DNA-binding NarL/FixJ family response regulator
MTETLRILEINIEKGTEVERDFSSDEVKEQELRDVESKQMLQDMLDKIDARQSALAKLAALGLTQDEIAAL